MGDNFLAGQRNHRQRGREQATAVLSRPTLFTRPDIVDTSYQITPCGDITLTPGTVVGVYVAEAPDRVNFARGECEVGYCTGDAAAALRQALIDTGEEGLVLEITKVSDLSGVAWARIVKEEADERPHRASA